MTTTANSVEDAEENLPAQDADPVLRADRRGYVLAQQSIDGFCDRSDVADATRLRLARWARRFTPDELSVEQEALLEHAGSRPRDVDKELLAAALTDAEEHLDRAHALGFYEELSPQQLELVRDPSRHSELSGRG